MPFAYYHRLSRRQQADYRRSDALHEFAFGEGTDFAGFASSVATVRNALESVPASPTEVATAASRLCACVMKTLDAPPLHVQIGKRRPANEAEELHGLYEPADGVTPARITVWMYTAERRQVVKFRTFLRTLVHEMCHHLDYELLGLQESFHTAGFFKRESFLYRCVFDADHYDHHASTANSGAPPSAARH